MRTVRRSKLIRHDYADEVNRQLQSTVDEFNAEGLIVSIDKVFAESARKAGNSNHTSVLYSYVLVVGYDPQEVRDGAAKTKEASE